MGRDWDSLRHEYKPEVEMCAQDPELGVVIHRFAPGKIVCRCGRSVVRSPNTKKRAGWYGKGLPPRRSQGETPEAGGSDSQDGDV